MSNTVPSPPNPPQPPHLTRRFKLYSYQTIGFLFIFIVPILALMGVFGDGIDKELVLRVGAVYLFLMVTLRILGKREFGQLSPLEFVSLLLIPEIVSSVIQPETMSLGGALIGVTTLLALTALTSLVVHRSKTVEVILTGEPTVLAYNGKMVEKRMNQERVTPDEIFTEMRRAGVEKLEDVAWAILEPGGSITIIPRENASENAPSEHS